MSHLDTRDDLREMADHYETILALDVTPTVGGAHGVPGSRVPPGMQEILDADEVNGGLGAVDEWAGFLCHILADERQATTPLTTPAKLRLIGEHAEHFLEHADELLALAFQDDLHDHLRNLRRLSKRGIRQIQTGMDCQDGTCTGHYVASVGTKNDAIECDKCKAKVSYSVWSSWPRARVTYVTVEHAARMAGCEVAAVKQRAKRGKWRRTGEGRDVRYHVDDIRGNTSALPVADSHTSA